MLTALIVFHVIVCLLLIVIVLLQFGKGAETGAVMGSSASQAIFTSSQQGNIFTKITTVLAILFMINSIAISTMTSKKASSSLMDDEISKNIGLEQDKEVTPTPAVTVTPAEAKKTETPVEMKKPAVKKTKKKSKK